MTSGTYAISSGQNADFARLSGDFNPLHMDPLYARRLQFGTCVIHGIHHMLATWERVHGQDARHHGRGVERITARFPNPVGIGLAIDYSGSFDEEAMLVDITASSSRRRVLSLKIQYGAGDDTNLDLPFIDSGHESGKPDDPGFPPVSSGASLPLHLDTRLARKLFPRLLESYSPAFLAQIVATTRIVGMHCPGLNSLFSALQLSFAASPGATSERTIRFDPGATDARFKRIKLNVAGPNMSGTLDSFYRPPPAAQPRYEVVRARVPVQAFAGRRALVIGGSRGVGECTAKILAAGGAETVITYHEGIVEARSIEAEVVAAGGQCTITSCDIDSIDRLVERRFRLGNLPTHVYFFASPPIRANVAGIWDRGLFAEYSRFYVEAFFELTAGFAEAAEREKAGIRFFFPSTVYIDKPEKGFAEYAAAKGAAEALCKQLEARYPGAEFRCPRLPRMATDQTSSILPLEVAAPLDVMLDHLLPGPPAER